MDHRQTMPTLFHKTHQVRTYHMLVFTNNTIKNVLKTEKRESIAFSFPLSTYLAGQWLSCVSNTCCRFFMISSSFVMIRRWAWYLYIIQSNLTSTSIKRPPVLRDRLQILSIVITYYYTSLIFSSWFRILIGPSMQVQGNILQS